MITKIIGFILFIIFTFTFCLTASETTRPVYFPDLRCQAMGGAGVVNAVGTFAYNYNPALLASKSFKLTLAGVQVQTSTAFFDVIDYMVDHSDDFKKLDQKYTPKLTAKESDALIEQLRRDAAPLDNIWYRGQAVPSIGVNISNFAFGIYNVSSLQIRPDVGLLIPKFQVQVFNDLVFALGYGRQFMENLALGANLKIIRRNSAPIMKIQVEEINGLEDTWEEGRAELKEAKSGYGLDLGAVYDLAPNLKLGATLQDFLGQIDGINTPTNLRIGVFSQPLPRLNLAAELEDFFNREGEKLFNKFHLGAEYQVPVLRFRLGFNQGYPTAGVGLDLRLIQFNYTYYRYEITKEPGQKSEGMHMFDFQITLF